MRHDTPHYRLIAASLTGAPPALPADWDWDQTVRIAAREEVLPILHGKLSCPPEIADFFEGIHQLNADRNRQLLAETESLAVLLNQAGIEPVLLKGAAYLVTGVYADPGDRLIRDIDLLVGPDQSRRAFEIIQNAGYEPYAADNPVAWVLHHHPALTQVHRVPVEVHHSLGHGACSAILSAGEMLGASTPFQLGRAAVRIPSPQHLMTHLVIHSQMQHSPHDRIWPSLREMYDLIALERRFGIAWGSIRERFRQHRRAALLDLHLMQVAKAMGIAPSLALGSGGIRWWYRRALWRERGLRYIDPLYVYARVVGPKIRFSRQLLRDPAGRRYVLSTPFRRSFYKRLLDDIARG